VDALDALDAPPELWADAERSDDPALQSLVDAERTEGEA